MTFYPHCENMKRATVYFDEDLHRALKVKAAEASSSVSDLVNDAIRQSFAEDLEDLQAFRDRANEPTVNFEEFLKKLSGEEKYRVRQGDYRILYEINDALITIVVVRIAHRGDVYRH